MEGERGKSLQTPEPTESRPVPLKSSKGVTYVETGPPHPSSEVGTGEAGSGAIAVLTPTCRRGLSESKGQTLPYVSQSNWGPPTSLLPRVLQSSRRAKTGPVAPQTPCVGVTEVDDPVFLGTLLS